LQRSAADQMDVKMKYGLAGARANIQHCAITVFDRTLPRDRRRCQVTAPYQLGVVFRRFFQSGDVFLRNN
jgi:hypothetical protein